MCADFGFRIMQVFQNRQDIQKRSIFAGMEVFYSNDIRDGRVRLSPEESAHCVKVLRHRAGDEVYVSGGDGNLYRCCLEEADSRAAVARVLSVEGGFGTHPYRLWMAVAPTKNIDRFETGSHPCSAPIPSGRCTIRSAGRGSSSLPPSSPSRGQCHSSTDLLRSGP